MKKFISSLVCLAAAATILGIVWPTWQVFRSFDNLELNAKKVITGTQLQTWATNLLGNPPTTSTPRVSELGTNFPRELLGLYHDPPRIVIYDSETNGDSVYPGWVQIYWGGGIIGHCGFEIGPTNFTSFKQGSTQWQPGVYFHSAP